MIKLIKREKRQVSQAEKFQVILCRYSALNKEEHNSPFLGCGLLVVTSFQRTQYRQQKEEFRVESLANKVSVTRKWHSTSGILILNPKPT